jgi:hypothetical protein
VHQQSERQRQTLVIEAEMCQKAKTVQKVLRPRARVLLHAEEQGTLGDVGADPCPTQRAMTSSDLSHCLLQGIALSWEHDTIFEILR